MKRFGVLLLLLLLLPQAAESAEGTDQRFLVIVLDGLRPDYVTEDLMPNLHALARRGVFFEDHHAVFPTVTRVNSSSLSTGAYPETHGLMGNSVYFPEADGRRALNTSDVENLFKIDAVTDGQLLTATTLGEVLEENGLKLLALSSGSSGSATLMNHRMTGGGVINTDVILPEEIRADVIEAIGPAPGDSVPATARNAWVVEAYVKIALEKLRPTVTYMWLTDPDHTAHGAGVGAPLTMDSLRGVDRDLGRILAAHEARGLSDNVNVLVTSDHGFSTHIGGFNLSKLLRDEGLADGVTLAGGAIHVKDSPPEQIRSIVKALQKTEWAGPIFTKAKEAGGYMGWVDGTLSFYAAHWQHERSADILVAPMWDDGENEYGFKGRTTYAGTAGHGSTSPYDIHNTLIAAGPAFVAGIRSPLPTANTDIAPTILYVLGLESPESMTGRAMREALAGVAFDDLMQVHTLFFRAQAGEYRVELSESYLDGRRYLNYARVER
ncbi:MAG: alkaline phosphatase family protein [Candidatus Hydrogenedentes bacterium]|nr:alkaline phosphatase family protein [Candidatus Hydrogenedentota bacterium]